MPIAVTPAAGGAAFLALPSAVQDLARFFLSLSGSSSQEAVSGIAGVTVSAAGSGGAVCPPASAGDTVTTCTTTVTPAGDGVSPAAPAAVPGVSGEQQRWVESRSRLRCSRSSSDGTDGRSKKRARRRFPSPGPSSRRRERHYRSSSDSSGDDRADVYPPRSERAPGGAPGCTRSSRAYDRSPRPGTSQSYARDAGIGQVLVVDPQFLRVRRMTTGLVPLSRLTLTGMIHSGLSWASSGAFMAWKSLRGYHQLVARLLLHWLMA